MFEELLKLADGRVANWPLMDSFVPTATITCLYILLVRMGPSLMKSRKPFDLHYFILFHNIFLVILNAYSFYLLLFGAVKAGYNFLCQPLLYSTDEGEMMVTKGIWWYYLLRAVDLLDTVILILRKKNSHLSFLHVYHHATMFPIWWMGVKFVAGGNAFFGPLLNSFVHMLMYSYYTIAALGPKYRKYLWWKRYLTVIQMSQFLFVIGHSVQTIITGCEQPFIHLHYVQMFYLLSLFLLFSNFYYQEYLTARNRKAKHQDTDPNQNESEKVKRN